MRSFFGNCKICHIYAGMNFHDYMTFIGNEEDQKISAYALCILKNYVLNVRLRQRINCGLKIVSKVV